jgi:hypothetical protein
LVVNGNATAATGLVTVNTSGTLAGSGTIGISTSVVSLAGGSIAGGGLTLGKVNVSGADNQMSGTPSQR